MQAVDSVELVTARREWILDRISAEQRVTTNSAASDLGVSVDTIRRDLRYLHDRGLLRRVHGGAVKASPLSSSFTGRATDDSTERNKLADAVVARLRPGQVVGLDAGTTSVEIASRLPRSLEITIITNGPAVAVALGDHPSASVILVGGEVDLRWMAATGSAAVDAIRNHHLDLAVVGVCSFDATAGATTRSWNEVSTKQALIASAAEVLIPVESHKLDTVSPFQVANAADLDVLLVTDAVGAERIEQYRAAGIDFVRT